MTEIRYKAANIMKIITIIFIILLVKLLYLQLIRGGYYYKISEENRIHLIIEPAMRGEIYDSKGRVLATNSHSFSAFYRPSSLKLSETEMNLLSKLRPQLIKKITGVKFPERIERLERNIPRNVAFKLLEQRLFLPSLTVTCENIRYYPHNELLSGVLGYISEVDRVELKELEKHGYKLGDLIGKSGIEFQYDRYLRGRDGGWVIEADAFGKHLRLIERIQPKRGNDIYLTIDLDLQLAAEEALKATGKRGSVIVMETKTGKIKALVSHPNFNPNYFVTKEENMHLRYLNDKSLPLYNRATQGIYPPGSVFKVILAYAGLAEKRLNLTDRVYCPGQFKLGTKVFKCWKKEGHGWVDFMKGMALSCDVYFYALGLKLGLDIIEKYARMFSLDKLSMIDLKGEEKGFIPSESWKRAKLKEPWYTGDTVNLSIGQGYIYVTPIALAMMTAIIANEGFVYKPYIVEKVVDATGKVILYNKPKLLTTIPIKDREIWEYLKKSLTEVVNSGTGTLCKIKDHEIAGKTGTAENPHGEDHALFTSFYPANEPELVVSVVVEHGIKGGKTAAPIARKVYERFIQIKNVSSN